ncbi:unnamed protein product [Rotaria magnacalcarata]|uniref:CCHC-type domain-containing protein n=6 Tax=Rotaria magnacalcarata TaxID=392030 RepID=A0A816G762_9BILA|nr:unnamed protein product [Rotaria magnacalcarata]CAF1671378.1 unnamed protein product [Rotaria magnacalcarata]CAF2078964.1 unnamed protein product [Rotaria magnacalcarata]CAF3750526.1 unnamed protein product [Rotaria magnacalcarata]
MNDTSKKNARIPNCKQVHDLVRSNLEKNDKNHRPQSQQSFSNTIENKANALSQQKQNHVQNVKSTAKPLLDCLKPEPLLTSKPYEKSISQRRRRIKRLDYENHNRSDNDIVNNSNLSPEKAEIDRSTIDIREPTPEHLLALKKAFHKVLTESSLSDNSLRQREVIFTKLHKLITNARSGSQINLYGSVYFECCLEKRSVMNIDIRFKTTSQYDALKEILDIIKTSDLCKDAAIDTDHKPSCINLITNEPNMRVKITSGYNRGLNLSKLIRIYIKFDERVIKLLRLFRVLSKTCDIDKADVGTLHPVVYHIMVIHFLQQVDQPVLPCLHEYAYGINNVPVTLNENHYPEFFKVCEKYSREWKSKNTTTVEMLFLQLLSYYVKTFSAKQFVVSIQTRMPVMKIDKNWRSRKLLVEDPTDIKRSLCQTMQSVRSIEYFRSTLNAALNYFARKQKKRSKTNSNQCSIENTDDDLIEIILDDINEIPKSEPSNSLHNSYKLFYKKLPPTIVRDVNIKQGRVRDYYRQTFDNEKNILPKGIIQLTSLNDKFDNLVDNDIQEAFQHDLENNFQVMDENDDDENENHSHLLQRIISHEDDEEHFLNENLQHISIEQQDEDIQDESLIGEDEQQLTNDEISRIKNETEQGNTISSKDEELVDNLKQLLSIDGTSTSDTHATPELHSPKEKTTTSSCSSPLSIETNVITTDNNNDRHEIPSPFTSPIKFDDIINNEQSNIQSNPSKDDSNELYYDFQAENFHAEQGAPYVCTTCNGIGHLKSECPELIIPNMIDLPVIDEQWIQILSKICRQITDRSKPRPRDIENRQQILNQLEKQFQKDYPDCNLYAFGSFYNGFGFSQSDLDVCLVFKDEREQNSDEVIRIMQRILRAMKSSSTFDEVQPVLQAKVPIIRTRHRQWNIAIDISLHNMLAIENTRLLKKYTEIDTRVSELGYMIKYLAKFCSIGDASRGTLSSYAYIIMLIHFLQQIQPPVLPVLQQLNDPTKKTSMYKKCSKWNVYFYEDLPKINDIWKGENKLLTGALWVEFLRFYTEQFNYEEHIVTIRQIEPLLKHEKGWLRQTIAIEDPFELSHNLAGGLSPRNWIMIRRVLIRSREQFGVKPENIDISNPDMSNIEEELFNIDELCPTNAPKRCEWCKGPYHIRKRCPKLAALSNDYEKKKRLFNSSEHQYYTNNSLPFSSNNSREKSYYNNSYNGYNHSKSASSNQRSLRYVANEKSSEFNNASHLSIKQTTNTAYQNNYPRKGCFNCGSFDHLKAQCPLLHKNNRPQKSNFAN